MCFYRTPNASSGISQCYTSIQAGTSFGGSGYVRLFNTYRPGVTFRAEMEFRTFNQSGLLLYYRQTGMTDHIELELREGIVSYRFVQCPFPMQGYATPVDDKDSAGQTT